MWQLILSSTNHALHVAVGIIWGAIVMVPVIALGVVMWKDPTFRDSFKNAKQKLKEMKIGL